MALAAHKPDIRPSNPNFSSGPCSKRPGFSLDALAGAFLGRSHRAKQPKARIAEVIDRSRAVLGIPADWKLGVVPASDTGAVEIALWSLLGARPVDILVFESFGEGWATDIVKQLKLPDARVRTSPRSIPRMTSSSPGTAPPPASASRTPTGSPPTGRASPSATRLRPRSP